MKKNLVISMSAAILMPMSVSAVTLSGVGQQSYAINGTTAVARPELAGSIIEDVMSDFSVSGGGETLSGKIQNRVIRSIDGTLDFYWRIIPDAGIGDIWSFRLGGFEGFSLDADWRIDGSGDVEPDTAVYLGDGTGYVNFEFNNNQVGSSATSAGYEESMFFFLDTDATSYDRSGFFDLALCSLNDCISMVYSTFAPAVPIPSAVWLFGSGLLGLVGVARRKTHS